MKDLALGLVSYHRTRNKAIGIEQDPLFVRQLARYMRHVATDEANVAKNIAVKAAVNKALIEEYHRLAKRVSGIVEQNMDNERVRSEGIFVLARIDEYMTQLSEELETLWQTIP